MESELEFAIKLAHEARKKAIAVRTNVGVCIVSTDKDYFQGANFENSYKKTYHAEEVALIQALMRGLKGTDLSYMVQLAFAEDKVYPCCLSCLAFLWEYTHPDFMIYTVWEGRIKHAASLKQLTSGFEGADIYPKK